MNEIFCYIKFFAKIINFKCNLRQIYINFLKYTRNQVLFALNTGLFCLNIEFFIIKVIYCIKTIRISLKSFLK